MYIDTHGLQSVEDPLGHSVGCPPRAHTAGPDCHMLDPHDLHINKDFESIDAFQHGNNDRLTNNNIRGQIFNAHKENGSGLCVRGMVELLIKSTLFKSNNCRPTESPFFVGESECNEEWLKK